MSNSDYCQKYPNSQECQNKGNTQSWNDLQEALVLIPKGLEAFIRMQFTPDGIVIMEIFEKTNMVISKGILDGLIKNIVAKTIKNIAEYTAESEFIAVRTMAAIGDATADVLSDVVVPVIGWVLFFLQLGGIWDLWDPCDLNEQIDSSTLTKLTTKYNKIFRDSTLANYGSSTDTIGNKFFANKFPIEYSGNNLLLQITQNSQQCKYYNKLFGKFFSSYLLTLRVNSYGYLIDWNSNIGQETLKHSLPDIKNKNWLKNFWNEYSKHTGALANHNTVAQNWIHRNWPFLLIIFISILIIIMLIIKKKNVKK